MPLLSVVVDRSIPLSRGEDKRFQPIRCARLTDFRRHRRCGRSL